MTSLDEQTRSSSAVAPEVAAGGPPVLGGVDHLALTVTDLDVSRRFYTDVLGFVVVMQIPNGRICMHPDTGFVLALLVHEAARREPFSELNTGADHVGFSASSREELEAWERRFESHGVRFTPIRDELFGSHLNFRDPDDIALEISSSNELMIAARSTLASGPMTAEAIAEFVAEHVGADYAAGQVARS